MDGDELRDVFAAAASDPGIDVAGALEQVGARARRRQRRRRGVASAGLVMGAVAVIAVVLAMAGTESGNRSTPKPVGVTTSTGAVYSSLPSRSGAAMAYDAARSRVVLFGGLDGSRPLNDTWVWDGHGWTAVHPAVAPPARTGAVMAYDPAAKELVLFGGEVPRDHQRTLALTDTWTWNGSAWAQVHPVHGPPWSTGLAMSYDARSKSVLLLTLPSSHPKLDLTPDGVGSRGDTAFGTWQWSGSDWRELPTPSAPLFAKGAVFHADPRLAPLPGGAGLLFYSWSVYTGSCPPPSVCGDFDPNGTVDSQTWTWDGTRWTAQHPGRAPVAGQLVVTPGVNAVPTIFAPDGKTWRWSGADWHETPARAGGPTAEGLAVYDDADHAVVAYAAVPESDGPLFDTWTWNGSWTRQSQPVPPPPSGAATSAPPTPPATTAPAATTAPSVPALKPCTRIAFALARQLQSTMQQPGAYFSLTNTSPVTCTLEGYPTLRVYDTAGARIPAAIERGSSFQINDPGAGRVVVAPGSAVYFGFGWVDVNENAGGSTQGCSSVGSASMSLPGSSVAFTVPARLNDVFCPPRGFVSAIAHRADFSPSTP